MNSITFTCEIVTPMFLAGADGKKPELRPPSIKGALRFWWRAMHGHLPIDDKKDDGGNVIEGLRTQEAEIFGGAGENARRSQISIKINENKTRKKKPWDLNISNETGVGYLFFAPLFITKRDYFDPDIKRTFKLSFASQSMWVLKEVVKAFACLVFFGGLGSRTRRGAGVIAIRDTEGNAKDALSDLLNIFNTKEIQDVDGLKAHLKTTLKTFIKNLSANGTYSSVNGCGIYLLEPKDDWQKALEFIGREYKRERSRIRSQVEKTPNFGFPIQHRKTPTKPKLTIGSGIPYKENDEWKIKGFSDRRSSPLIISLIKTQNDKFFPVALNLTGELLPSGKKIVDKNANELIDKGSDENKKGIEPDSQFVHREFLEKLSKEPTLTL